MPSEQTRGKEEEEKNTPSPSLVRCCYLCPTRPTYYLNLGKIKSEPGSGTNLDLADASSHSSTFTSALSTPKAKPSKIHSFGGFLFSLLIIRRLLVRLSAIPLTSRRGSCS